MRIVNTSGTTGVWKHGSKWVAYITRFNERRFLGTFSVKDDAVMARKQAELTL